MQTYIRKNELNQVRQAAVIACSNGLSASGTEEVRHMQERLRARGIIAQDTGCIRAGADGRSGTAQQRAHALMDCYKNPEIQAIFDVSGGDMANEVLPYLDFDTIARNRDTLFWGYSDLTVLLNAIYARTGNRGVLYHMPYEQGQDDLFCFDYSFLQGDGMQGIVTGGNLRCLLKLAGTRYFPDMRGKILFLEARSGGVPQLITYLSQLQQMGVFGQVSGILLGTFTQMQREQQAPAAEQLIQQFVPAGIPIAVTGQIGHAPQSRALMIGESISL